MCDAELRNLEGRFNISQTWNDAYADQATVTYTSLRNEVIAGVKIISKIVI